MLLKKELLVTSRDFSLKIESFKPSELKIELIRETARMVPVVPKYSAPPPGYDVEYAFPLTAAVMIRGREDIVAQLAKTGIETEEIDISAPPPGNADEWDIQPVPARIPSSVTIGGKSYPITCTDLVQCHIHLRGRRLRRPSPKSRSSCSCRPAIPTLRRCSGSAPPTSRSPGRRVSLRR